MNTPGYRDWVTVADVLDTGACFDGVVEFVKSIGGKIADFATNYLDNPYVQNAAKYGNCNGNGNCNGYG